MLSEISQVLHSQNRNSKINPTRKIYVAFLYIINIYLHTVTKEKKRRDRKKAILDMLRLRREYRCCSRTREKKSGNFEYSQEILWLRLRG